MIKRIGVIGGSRLSDDLSEKIAYECGFRIAEKGFQLITGGVGGAGLMASKGAFDYLIKSEKDPQEYIISVVPIGIKPAHNYGAVVHRGATWAERRAELIKMANIFLVISGAAGTANEVELALKGNKLLIPFACTGGAAHMAWQLLKKMQDPFIPKELIDTLSPENDNAKDLLIAVFDFIEDNKNLL